MWWGWHCVNPQSRASPSAQYPAAAMRKKVCDVRGLPTDLFAEYFYPLTIGDAHDATVYRPVQRRSE